MLDSRTANRIVVASARGLHYFFVASGRGPHVLRGGLPQPCPRPAFGVLTEEGDGILDCACDGHRRRLQH